MNENMKTLAFVAVAAAVVVVAMVSRPSLPVSSEEEAVNQPLYPHFTDPLKATSLEIAEYDEGRGEVYPFKVAQVERKGKNRWSIPSHDDYPADAKDQMASAAAGLMGLKPLEKVSENEGDQREYGVVDPESKALKLGQTGVGEKVVMKNKEGKELLALVIGKEVPSRPGLRYVRKVGQSPIYIVEVKTDKLSTKFENWIERNLLQINTFDMKQVQVGDYSIRPSSRGLAILQNGKMQLDYNDAGDPKWKMVEDRKFVPDPKTQEGRWEPVKIAADEELNTAKLDELKTALDDLKIVDVSRKPAGLSADLKVAGDFAARSEAQKSLEDRGFFPAQLEANGPVELFSNEGEIHLIMKDGVEYVLRFGGIAGNSPSKKDEKPKGKGKDAAKSPDKKDSGVSRYLFVMAEFDPDIIPKPQLEPLPEVKKEAAQKPAEEKKPADAKKPAEEKKPEPPKSAEKKAEPPKPAEKKPEEKKAEPKKPETPKPEAPKPAANAGDKKQPEAKTAAAEQAVKAERERIEKDNKRKQDEYKQKIADGKKRVDELNNRFADWYYVISDEVYRKIHLSHDELFRKKGKEKKDDHAGHDHSGIKDDAPPADPFEKLKQQGPGAK